MVQAHQSLDPPCLIWCKTQELYVQDCTLQMPGPATQDKKQSIPELANEKILTLGFLDFS